MANDLTRRSERTRASALPLAPADPRRSSRESFASPHRRAWAQQTYPKPEGGNRAQDPADPVTARQSQQESESGWPEKRPDLTKRQNATGDRADAARGREAGGFGQQDAVPGHRGGTQHGTNQP